MTLPALVESTADVWGTAPETGLRPPTSDLPEEQLPPSDYAPAPLSRPHTLDYWEREAIFARLRLKIIELKILAGMASPWPRPNPKL